MKYFLIVLVVLGILSLPSFSAEAPVESEFQLDQGLVDRLYQESVTESKSATAQYSAGLMFTPALSFFSPSQMNLSNDYFKVPYSQTLGTVPGISILASAKMFNWGGLYFMGLGGVSYSMKEAVQPAYSKTASADPIRTTKLTLHQLPLVLGTRIEYRFSGLESIRPFVHFKGGAEWLYQLGQLDGIEQGFWVPYYRYGGGLTFLDAPSSPDRWFGGFSLSASQHQSFSSDQEVNGLVFDLGFNIVL